MESIGASRAILAIFYRRSLWWNRDVTTGGRGVNEPRETFDTKHLR